MSFTRVTREEAGPLELWHGLHLAQATVFPRFLQQPPSGLFCLETGSHSTLNGALDSVLAAS